MKKIILIPNATKDNQLTVTDMIVRRLSALGCECFAEQKYKGMLGGDVSFYDEIPSAELIIVVGGDGSVIDASRISLKYDIPLLGVNLGKVGYLSEVEPDNIALLDKLVCGDFRIDEKMILCVEKLCADGSRERSERFGVNDVVISHDNYFGIADFKLENGQGDLVKYRADGIIVATPAGSTAYSLSAGGPIVSHDLDSITVTPVCPHSFFDRSVIYGPDERLKISNAGEDPLNISVDGRYFSTLASGEQCVIYKSERRFKMITFTESNMFTTLFNKIKIISDNL